jgi:hypothetical protein
MKAKTFIFQGMSYKYWQHNAGERVVEMPIILKIVKGYRERKILEVGNVLHQCDSFKHDVLDKYEKADGVLNEDVVDFKTQQKYDLIVSISTLEHVGYSPEEDDEPMKILQAFTNLKHCLASDGRIVVTLPMGWNLNMDQLIRDKVIRFDFMSCMRRVSANNEWVETDWNDIKYAKYGAPFCAANGLIIGEIRA